MLTSECGWKAQNDPLPRKLPNNGRCVLLKMIATSPSPEHNGDY